MSCKLASRLLLLLCSLTLLAACSSSPRINTESDPTVDLSRYRTFAFYSPLAIEQQGYSTMTSMRLRAAVRTQMEAHGYAYSEERPELWVNINGYLQEKTDVSTMPDVDYDYYYSYRAGAYVAVPYWRDRINVRRYTEGTLNVDVVDARERRLVWEGVAVGTVGRLDPQRRNALIDQTVSDMFAAFPYRTGAR